MESKATPTANVSAAQTARIQRLATAVSQRSDYGVNQMLEDGLSRWLAQESLGHPEGNGLASLMNGFDAAFYSAAALSGMTRR